MPLRRFYAQKLSLFLWALLAAGPLRAIVPWAPLGPDGGDARRIVTDPRDRTHIYLGTANGWIYESRTSGASWVRLAQIGKRDDLVVDSIVIDQSDPKHLLVGAWVLDHPDGGLFVSADGGHTWINQAEMRGQSVRALTASPSDPKIYVAGSLSGVFRSVDAGHHWARISPAESSEIHEIQSIAVDPQDPNVIYAGTWHLPWKTVDAGEHWESMKQGIIDDSDVFSIIIDPVSPQTVYASACSGIYKSDDSGSLFHKIQGIPSTARRTRVLLQDPHQLSTVFAGTTEGLFRSLDAGATWTRTTGPEVIVNDVSVDIADGRHVLIATNRGGVLSSEDGGDTFHSSNGGFSARQITALKHDRNHPATLFVGVVNDKDWGGVFESQNGGVNWLQTSEGLEGRDVFSLGQAPDGTMIAGTAHGIYRLDESEKTWLRVENVVVPVLAPVPSSFLGTLSKTNLSARSAAPPHRVPIQPVRSLAATTNARRRASLDMAKSSHTKSSGPKSQRSLKLDSGKRRIAPANRSLVARKGRLTAAHPGPIVVAAARSAQPPSVRANPAFFDGGVYSIVTASGTMFAATSAGLFASVDNGRSWTPSGPKEHSDWLFLASTRSSVVAGTHHSVAFSVDAGSSWASIRLPQELTQLSALAIEPSGTIWAGSREGVFLSSDAGNSWSTPKDLYAHPVSNILYDETAAAMTVTAAGSPGIVFTVQLPQKTLSYFEAGWTLRFAYPVGDHLVAATMFDGLVVQPRTAISPASQSPSSPSSGAVAAHAIPQH